MGIDKTNSRIEATVIEFNMYVQLFPIYGFMVGVNYWNTNFDTDEETDEVEHLFQIMFYNRNIISLLEAKNLRSIVERHKEWYHMAKSFGCDNDSANELVQEMYVRMHKYVGSLEKVMYNETEINTYYVYVTLRNLYLSDFTSQSIKTMFQCRIL